MNILNYFKKNDQSKPKTIENENKTNVKDKIECERALSCLKRIKTYDRTTMQQSRLSSLAILNFNNEFISLLNYEEAVDTFNTFYKRKMKF